MGVIPTVPSVAGSPATAHIAALSVRSCATLQCLNDSSRTWCTRSRQRLLSSILHHRLPCSLRQHATAATSDTRCILSLLVRQQRAFDCASQAVPGAELLSLPWGGLACLLSSKRAVSGFGWSASHSVAVQYFALHCCCCMCIMSVELLSVM